MDRWYAWVDSQIYGPYRPEQLTEFVKPDVLLCREGTEDWKSAKEFQELSFLWVAATVELPPNVGWMVRKAGSGAVIGPFSKNALIEMVKKGDVLTNDWIKHTEWDEWELLPKTKLLAGDSPTPKPAAGAAPPSPEGFHKVVRDSSDDELMKEYKQNYKLYARRERKLLKEELLRRGLIKKTFGLF